MLTEQDFMYNGEKHGKYFDALCNCFCFCFQRQLTQTHGEGLAMALSKYNAIDSASLNSLCSALCTLSQGGQLHLRAVSDRVLYKMLMVLNRDLQYGVEHSHLRTWGIQWLGQKSFLTLVQNGELQEAPKQAKGKRSTLGVMVSNGDLLKALQRDVPGISLVDFGVYADYIQNYRSIRRPCTIAIKRVYYLNLVYVPLVHPGTPFVQLTDELGIMLINTKTDKALKFKSYTDIKHILL